jgi:hypothetical protein
VRAWASLLIRILDAAHKQRQKGLSGALTLVSATATLFVAIRCAPAEIGMDGGNLLSVTVTSRLQEMPTDSSSGVLVLIGRIKNQSTELLWVQRCEGFNSALTELQWWREEGWTGGFRPNCELRLVPPRPLPKNKVYVDTALVPCMLLRGPQSRIDPTATYRAVYLIRRSPNGKSAARTFMGPLVSMFDRTSKPFAVTGNPQCRTRLNE